MDLPLSTPPSTILLGILYLINPHTSNGQHKEPCRVNNVENNGDNNNQEANPPPPPPRDRLGDFRRTKPPTFSYAVEPTDADDWLKSIEKKLQVVQCNNREKVLLTSHQLSGPAAD
jgi:hypothetical protein